MQCPECASYNSDSATFCDQCGARLPSQAAPAARSSSPASRAPAGRVPADSGSSRSRVRPLTVVLVFLTLALGGYALSGLGGDEGADRVPDPSDPAKPTDEVVDLQLPTAPTVDTDPSVSTAPKSPAPDSPRTRTLSVAQPEAVPEAMPEIERGPSETPWVVLDALDEQGERRVSLSVPVVGKGWVAVPLEPVLGTTTWKIRVEGRAFDVEKGSWFSGEPIALWRVPGLDGSRLEAVDPSFATEPEAQVPLRAGRWNVGESGPPADGYAIRQDGVVVGLRIPVSSDRSISALWTGAVVDDVQADMSLRRLYEQTFGGGREEAYLRATRARTDLSKFRQMVDALALPRRIDDDKAPADLTDRAIGESIVRVGSSVRDSGRPSLVSQRLDGTVIDLLRSARLLELALAVRADTSRYDEGIALGERWIDIVAPVGARDREQVEGWLAVLYSDAIGERIARNDLPSAWSFYQSATVRHAADPEIHLRGVELLLLDGDWQGASNELAARTYPRELSDRVEVLRRRISDLRALDGKIVIRFAPGARRVLTDVVLGGRYTQRFLVDTGASITTIPVAAANALGIRVTPSTPEVFVRTAGGTVRVPQVTLDELSIDGWIVRNVDVVIHDLPGMEEEGLLGTNVLGQFRVELRTNEGLLILEPR